jgi:hypothetical protein
MAIDLRCSAWARRETVDPIGTAGSYAGYLLVPLPLPWPRDISEVPELVGVATRAKQLSFRLQALAVGPDDDRRFRCYRWQGTLGRYVGWTAGVGDDIASTALQLLHGEVPRDMVEISGTDVLICTHGNRDRCCGSMGTALHKAVGMPAALGDNVSVWRTSHTGGHRFAPTALVLPEGTCWAYLDRGSLGRIVAHDGLVSDELRRYRGCAGLGGAMVQAVERELLGTFGWDLLTWRRSGIQGTDGRVRLTVVEPGRGPRTFTALVERGRRLRVPTCGAEESEQEKTEDELVVRSLREGESP